MTRAFELGSVWIEVHRAGKVCAVLIKRNEFIAAETQQNTWVIFRRITEKLIAANGHFIDAGDRNARISSRTVICPEPSN
jgi:hypothetical protein